LSEILILVYLYWIQAEVDPSWVASYRLEVGEFISIYEFLEMAFITPTPPSPFFRILHLHFSQFQVSQNLAIRIGTMPCIDIGGNLLHTHTPCSSSTKSLCCSDGFECRKNGLCTLPETSNTLNRDDMLYLNKTYGKHVLYAELPSCSSRKWGDCGFRNGACCEFFLSRLSLFWYTDRIF